MITATANDNAGRQFLAGMARRQQEYDAKQERWFAAMRTLGVVAAHPDDGWVDRENDTVHLCYPHIMGRVKAGALIALGDHEKWRIVRLVSFEPWLIGTKPTDGRWLFAHAH